MKIIKLEERRQRAIRQLKELDRLAPKDMILAAEWDENWKVLISTILSAQTKDETTIAISEVLYGKYNSLKKLADAPLSEIRMIIRPINYHKTKSRHIKETARMIVYDLGGRIPETLEELLNFPGVGRKVGNVYLAEAHNSNCIGVDTHVGRISRKLGWSGEKNPHKVEKDLEELFPKKYWNSINYTLVRFGRSFGRSRRKEDEILERIKQKTYK
jgi:endonuclease III